MNRLESRDKGWAANFGLLAGAILVSLVVAELLLRIVQPDFQYAYIPQKIVVSHFSPSPLLPFTLKPNNRSQFSMLEFDTTVVTNSQGLRDRELDTDKPRILCIGDSFTFGYGVENEEAFCAKLEGLFGGKYEFINAGFADGLSPDTYALWLSKHLDVLNPVGILVTLCQNDQSDVVSNRWFRGESVMSPSDHGLPDRIDRPGSLTTPDGAWLRNNLSAKLPPWVRRLIKSSYVIAFLRERLLRDEKRPASQLAQDAAADQKFLRALDMLYDIAGNRLLGIYLIMDKDQASPSHMDKLIREFGSRRHVPILLNKEDFTLDDYFRYDPHWNVSGQAKAAQYLHRALTDLGL